ncbi:MAG TPA: ABC transporter permease [Candidatus Acidoferrum sp.]|nr:ABC transporter permease [Candidatus Acidoferrum sp.]
MHTLWQDVRFGLRMLAKHRVATLVCVVALGLGIGANAAMFSLAEAFLLHPVPFENSDRIVVLPDAHAATQDGAGFGPEDFNPVAPATYIDWKKETHSFDDLAAYAWDEVNLTADREAQKVQDFRVTANFFPLIGVQPLLGRTFLPEEEEPGRDQEIILSYGLWEQRYASDPNVLKRVIKVDGKSFNVVGVMKKGFDFPMPAEAWIPLALSTKERLRRDNRHLWVLGRLKQGVSFSESDAEMKAVSERQAEAYPDTNKAWRLQPQLLRKFITGTLTRQYTVMLMVAVGFVLLIACADVANVQFARITGRTSEFAVRAAMGGSRWRLVRQLLIESVMLSMGGAALGLFLAQWDIQMILAHMPADVARFVAGWKTIRLDTNAFVFALGIAVISGVVSGIAPALMGSRASIAEALKEGGRGSSVSRARHRLRGALVVAEVALAMVLLVGAGLMVKGFQGLLNVNESYRPTTLLTLNFSLPEAQYAQPAARLSFHEQMLRRLDTVSGVQAASLVTHVPYAEGGGIGETEFSIEGRALTGRGETRTAILETTTPNYFNTLNIALRDGRLLGDTDGAESPQVAVISGSLARRYFPGENPLGRHIKIGKAESEGKWMTVVGVVNDVHYSWIVKDDVPTIYRSFRQTPPYFTTVVLRTAGEPLKFVSAARAEIAAIDANLPLYNIKPMDKVITESIVGIAYVATMMAVLGAIALVLASVGVFGVMSYSVSERTHEIGIRMSMGAQTGNVLALVLRSGMFLTALGLGIGLPIAFLLAQALSSLLYGVQAADPMSFIGLPLLLLAVAGIASYLPARRAAHLDPLQALRHD